MRNECQPPASPAPGASATPPRLISLSGRSPRQEDWARRNRERFVTRTLTRYGENIHTALVNACNRYHQAYHWIDYENQTQQEILAAITQQAESEQP
jgi:hypothetical protein